MTTVAACPAIPSKSLLANAPQLATLLECSRRHVETLDATGRLPRPIRLGRLKRWSLVEIKTWLAHGAPARDQWDRIKDEALAGGFEATES